MGITRQERQVTWAGANFKSVAAGASSDSDEITPGGDAVEWRIHLKADNDAAGARAADAEGEVWLKTTGGDPDGAGADEFDSDGGGELLAVLDVSSGGEDPHLVSVDMPVNFKKAKIFADNLGLTDAVTFSVTITEKNAS